MELLYIMVIIMIIVFIRHEMRPAKCYGCGCNIPYNTVGVWCKACNEKRVDEMFREKVRHTCQSCGRMVDEGVRTCDSCIRWYQAREAQQRAWEQTRREWEQARQQRRQEDERTYGYYTAYQTKAYPTAVSEETIELLKTVGYRASAMAAHPDRGGDAEKLVSINATRDYLEKMRIPYVR